MDCVAQCQSTEGRCSERWEVGEGKAHYVVLLQCQWRKMKPLVIGKAQKPHSVNVS